MATTTEVLTALRQHMIAAAIVRSPKVAGAAAPALIEPRGGAIAPGEGEGTANDADLIVSLFNGGEMAPGPAEGWQLKTTVDIRYRGKTAERIARADALLVASLHEAPGIRRRAWDMGGLFVIETGIWTGLTRLGADREQGFDFVTKVYVEAYR